MYRVGVVWVIVRLKYFNHTNLHLSYGVKWIASHVLKHEGTNSQLAQQITLVP